MVRKSTSRTQRKFGPDARQLTAEAEARASHPWAVEAVRENFSKGISQVLADAFVGTRFDAFAARQDPITATLLQGMDSVPTARVLVGNFTLAHTIATQSRFWLEDAIIAMFLRRPREPGAPPPAIYSMSTLGDGWLNSGRSIWDVGEGWREELISRSPWRPLVCAKSLSRADAIVAEEDARLDAVPPKKRPSSWPLFGLTEELDTAAFSQISASLGTSPARPTSVRCNLLIVEPDVGVSNEPTIWGIRYINPTVLQQEATARAERLNVLRLYAALAQEKPLRDPSRITAAVAELVPRPMRRPAPHIDAHFSPKTHWDAGQLWDFIGVPFAAVTAGIRDAGAAMREELVKELRTLEI